MLLNGDGEMKSKANNGSSSLYVMSPAKKKEMAEKAMITEQNRLKALQHFESLSPEEKLIELKKQELLQNERIHNEQMRMHAEQIRMQNDQMMMQQAQYNAMKKCPKCHSTSITGQKKGMTWGTGLLGSKKVYCTCMSCGYRWKAGKK